MRNSRLIISVTGFGALLLVIAGCKEPTASVSGKATYKGDAVAKGSVSFHLKGKGVAQDAKLNESGSFTMAAPLPPGTYHVYYVPPTVEPPDPSKKAPPPDVKVAVPRKYHTLESTDLTVDVKAGANTIPIEFKD